VRVASLEQEREQWIQEWRAGESISEIAARYQVSRKSLYKWIERYEEFGQEGLRDLSRAPLQAGQGIGELWRERMRGARQRHPRWGAPKLHWELEQRYGRKELPSISSIGRVLRESGLSQPRRRVRAHGTGPFAPVEGANDAWGIDFKGWWRTRDGSKCEPLTITDQATRYLLCCQAVPSTSWVGVRARMERIFEQYGLPRRMRSDNGVPFGNRGECGLSHLSVWWLELGIQLERIAPGHPQQNGRHERMHRTLAEEVSQRPEATLRKQQQRMDLFRQQYNEQRPHQALGQAVPAALYQPSPRPFSRHIDTPQYPPEWEQCRVYAGGKLQWSRKQHAFISHVLVNKRVGLEPAQDGLWKVWFYRHWLGMWDERACRFQHARLWQRNQAKEGDIS
jgi:putative transposase